MFSKINNSIQFPTETTYKKLLGGSGTNKSGTSCTVSACKAPSSGGNCILM